MDVDPAVTVWIRTVWGVVLSLNLLGAVLLLRNWYRFPLRPAEEGELQRTGGGPLVEGVVAPSRGTLDSEAGRRLLAGLESQLPWCQPVAVDGQGVQFVNRYVVGAGLLPAVHDSLFTRGALRARPSAGGEVEYTLDYTRLAATRRRSLAITISLLVLPNLIAIVPLDLYLRLWRPEWTSQGYVYHLFHIVWLPLFVYWIYRLGLRRGRQAVRRIVEAAATVEPDAG